MSAYQQKAIISRIEKLAGDIYRFTLKAPDIAAEASPGQFIMVRTGEGMDPLLRRPFSVHQVLEGGLVQILFKAIGKGTRALAEMEAGRKLDVLGPVGRGFTITGALHHYLVGGGIGIAPLLFHASRLFEKSESSAVKVFLGARKKDEIAPLADDFEAMGLEVQIATEDGSLGNQGLVTDLLAPLQTLNQTTVYTCGPHPMLRAVVGICRDKDWGCQVSLETIMACGLAACLGCAVLRGDMNGYDHVCKDGPVFNADEVAWL